MIILMQTHYQQSTHDQYEWSTPAIVKFYDSLEEDSSDGFSSDSLECRKEREDREERSLASKKHLKRKDSSSAERKKEGISEKESSKESDRKKEVGTSVPFYKGEVTVSHIHKLRENDCKAKDTRNRKDLTTRNFTKQRKHLVQSIPTKNYLPSRTDDKGVNCFLGRWLIQANVQNRTQRKEDSKLQSHGTLSGLMKDLSMTECPSRRLHPCSSGSETRVTLNKTSRTAETNSCTSFLLEKRHQSYNKKDFVKENKATCTARSRKNVSYLQNYQEKRYGLQNLSPRKPPEGSSCSTNGDSSVFRLSNSDLEDKQDVPAACDDDEDYSFYMGVIENDMRRHKFNRAADASLCSGSATTVQGSSEDQCSRKRTYVPYKGKDYCSLPSLGGLGPDHNATKEKYDLRMKQKNYGNCASRKNLLSLRKNRIVSQMQRHQHLLVPLPFQPALPAASASVRQPGDGGCKKTERHPRQGKKLQQRPRSVGTRRGPVNRIQEVALLQTLQKRHLKEVEAVETIRKQMK